MPNPYQAFLYPKANLGMILQEEASKKKQGISTYLMKILLEHFKDKFVEKWSLDEYNAYHKVLSATIKEQKKQKAEREKKRKAEEKRKTKEREKALKLKEKELAIREENLGLRNAKQARKKLTEKQCEKLFAKVELFRKKIFENPSSRYASQWKEMIEKFLSELRHGGCLEAQKEGKSHE